MIYYFKGQRYWYFVIVPNDFFEAIKSVKKKNRLQKDGIFQKQF